MRSEEWSLREFRALHAVINQRSVTAAAAELGLSQPAISRAIGNLEEKFGMRLFEKSGRSIVPTDSALRLNDHVMPLLKALDDIRIKDFGYSNHERLKISVPPTFAAGFMQDALASFREKSGNIEYEMDVRSSHGIIEQVSEGICDIGISDMTIESKNVLRQSFCKSRMVCIAPANHPLGSKQKVNINDIKEYGIVALSKQHASRRDLDRLFHKHDAKMRITIETNTSISALMFVKKGFGVSFMNPFPLNLVNDDQIKVITFEPTIEYSCSFVLPPSGFIKTNVSRLIRHLRNEAKLNNWPVTLS